MPIAGEEIPKPTVEVRFSYVVELLMAATLVTNRPSSLSGFDEDWQARQRALLPSRSLAFLERTKAYSCPTLSIIDFAMRWAEYDDPSRFLSLVRAASIEEFAYVILNSDLPRDIVASCLRDPASAAAQVSRLSYFSRMPAASLVALFSDPAGFREELMAFIESNRTAWFDERVRALEGRYAERSREIRALLERKSPLEAAEELKRRPFSRQPFSSFVFVPSYFEGFMNITSQDDRNFLFVFNVYPNTHGANAVGEVLAERLRVLGDRTRVEILRMLAVAPSYGKEIASRLELTTATVSRHLDQLKSAGLVIEEKADSQNVKLVRIDHSAVEALFDTARRFFSAGEVRGEGCRDSGRD
jgi:DNA-binding transcriptional ArsR family regulator